MQQRSGSSTSSSSFLTSTTASTMSNRTASSSSSSRNSRGHRGMNARRGTKPIRSSSLNRAPQHKTKRNEANPSILDPSYWSTYNLNSMVASPMSKALEMVDYVGQTFQKAVYSPKDGKVTDPHNSQPDLDQLSQEESEKEDATESYDDDDIDLDMGHEVEYCEPEVRKVLYTLPAQYDQPPARHRTTRKLGRLNRQNLNRHSNQDAQQKQQQSNIESPTSVLPLSSFLEASTNDATTYSMSDADSTLEGLDFVDDWSMYSKGSQSTALSSLADSRLMQGNRCEV